MSTGTDVFAATLSQRKSCTHALSEENVVGRVLWRFLANNFRGPQIQIHIIFPPVRLIREFWRLATSRMREQGEDARRLNDQGSGRSNVGWESRKIDQYHMVQHSTAQYSTVRLGVGTRILPVQAAATAAAGAAWAAGVAGAGAGAGAGAAAAAAAVAVNSLLALSIVIIIIISIIIKQRRQQQQQQQQ